MRVVFMGTPEFSVPSLKALVKHGYDVAGVFCQPDKARGRGGKVTFCPVKETALSLSLPVFQPVKMRRDGLDMLKSLCPDIAVTAAYGQILSKANLAVPRLGTINVHASLLPKYRGPAPVQWAIINGEKTTGITTMFTDIGVDTGDIALRREVPIADDATYGETLERLSVIGAETLIETLERIKKGSIERIPQNPAEATHYPMLMKTDGKIDFVKSAESIVNLVRGVDPWPGAYVQTRDGVLKVWKAAQRGVEGFDISETQAGMIVLASQRDGLLVCCGEGTELEIVELCEIQAPGGRRMKARDYLRGNEIGIGTILG